MQFVTVEGRSLKRALKPLVETIERWSTIPILGHVRLGLDGAGLRLSATDLDIEAETTIDVIDGDRAGGWQICLPARQLAAIAHVAGVMPVRIAPGSGEEPLKTTISLGEDEAVYTLDSLPAADFPSEIVPRGALLESFSNGQLTAQLDKVRAFISREETRYYLNGVCWDRGPKDRLGCCRISPDPAEPAARIIPRKAVILLCRHMAGADVRIHDREGGGLGLVFEADGLTLRTKLIDGTFPDFDKIVDPCLEKAGAFTLGLKRPDVAAALARIRVFGREIGRALRFEAQEGRLVLARSGGDGGVRAKTASPWPEGLAAFGLNAAYFGDMVAGCSGDIRLGIASLADPLLVSDDDPEMIRILMPMRV
jgi:DNA polymerase-3 subunit beta